MDSVVLDLVYFQEFRSTLEAVIKRLLMSVDPNSIRCDQIPKFLRILLVYLTAYFIKTSLFLTARMALRPRKRNHQSSNNWSYGYPNH